ncbi:MAG: GIY-YIG nuclease family protein [Candidatus Edwardsbacteria bacterium]|nr:GIY-YIG nuclease family protein [Candidatus Edwardsbacteria bacterium]MBU1576323.1 GIY-YIG nuclease family protein [Candidatus Edwardsbacteria bacterium]MBU2462876.1 GIY-YIG nuclease family protein [Candidatus Edwardsbacteria bacterium]MBU2593935.1 GIY-YIG nuclease family protein [Candidatus Edwardsbacteria bacterium]
MPYFVYILKSVSLGTRYIGSTANIEQRIKEHNSGKCTYTRNRRPWVLIYKEEFPNLSEARKRERYFKTGQGREFIDKVIG